MRSVDHSWWQYPYNVVAGLISTPRAARYTSKHDKHHFYMSSSLSSCYALYGLPYETVFQLTRKHMNISRPYSDLAHELVQSDKCNTNLRSAVKTHYKNGVLRDRYADTPISPVQNDQHRSRMHD